MGVILSIIGVKEPPQSDTPEKILLCTFRDTPITLAHLLNFLISHFVVILIILLEYGVIPAVKQGFYCGDPLISHKYQGDTVTPEILGVTAFLIPLFILTCLELLESQSFKNINIYSIVFYMQECVVGTTLVLLITSVAKVMIGEHRPHFFDTCEPDTAINCTIGTFIETYTCTSKRFSYIFLVDASLSFPSGHSSITWFIAIYLCFIIHNKTITVNAGYVMRPFLISLVLTWSLLCSLSRITDRRHHWWDVLTGTIFGILAALYSVLVLYGKMKKNAIITKDIPMTIL